MRLPASAWENGSTAAATFPTLGPVELLRLDAEVHHLAPIDHARILGSAPDREQHAGPAPENRWCRRPGPEIAEQPGTEG
ncbi:hypothetical protein GCM10027615_08220 [Plantactinospora veratri]